MKTTILKTPLIAISLLISLLASSQNQEGFKWIKLHGDVIDFNPEWVLDMEVDRFGNLYVAGEVNDLFVRDSLGNILKRQSNPTLDSLYNHGGKDIWVAKYNPEGQNLWHRYAGSGSDDEYYDMVCDENGNCYISGSLRYNNLRPAHTFRRQLLADNERGTFVAKLSANGNLQWHKSFGGDTIQGSYYEYQANIYDLSLENHIKAFFNGGGDLPWGYMKLFDRDSLDLGIH